MKLRVDPVEALVRRYAEQLCGQTSITFDAALRLIIANASVALSISRGIKSVSALAELLKATDGQGFHTFHDNLFARVKNIRAINGDEEASMHIIKSCMAMMTQ